MSRNKFGRTSPKPAKTASAATSQAGDQMTLWVHRNRNKLTEIAAAANVSPQFVHMVSRGERKSKDGKVEGLLREAGAPIAAAGVA